MTVDVVVKGPLFDGRAPELAARCASDITDRVAAFALEAVQRNLDRSIKHPTPYYETQINLRVTAESMTIHERSVNDRGVIYGGFLEGTSSRNQTTRFKGYSSFRKAATQTEQAAPRLANQIVDQYVSRMNG
jgi:hypothetical protein